AAPCRARHLRADERRARALRCVARADAPRGRTATLARQLLRVARPADLRLRARAPVVADPRRARVLLRHRVPDVVAARAGPAAPTPVRPSSRLRLRRLCPRLSARLAARTAAEAGVRLLRACAPDLGSLAPHRPGDRGRDDGERASARPVRRLPLLVRAVP